MTRLAARLGPNRSSVYAHMPATRHHRSASVGIGLFLLSATLYFSFTLLAVTAPFWWLQGAAGLAAGFQIGLLFVIGHDACHESLTPSRLINRLIATLCFLPAWHPYSTWRYTHNGLHHGWTNVRGKEIVYTPFSKDQYDRLPAWRQRAERWFRSPVGVATFYFFTVFLWHEILPSRARGPKGRGWQAFQWERLLVICFGMVLFLGSYVYAERMERMPWWSLTCAVLIPALCYFSLFSVVTFLHHTHPRAPWFDLEAYEYFDILRATVHVEFPRPIEIILHEILQHTAHHADTRIPLYRLNTSQLALESAFPRDIIHEPWSWSSYLRTMQTCRLFDYEKHCWLDWDGTALTPPLLSSTILIPSN